MRSILCLALLLAYSPQTSSAHSDVVGNLDYTLPAGNSIWVPPFVADDTFSGRVDEIVYNSGSDETFISLNTESLPAADSHYLEIGEGPEAGLSLDILSSTANGVTVKGDVQAFGLSTNHKVIVREHLTLGGLLPEGANFSAFQDTVTVFNADGSRLDVFWNPFSGSWTDAFNVSWDDQKILPGQGVLVFLSQELTIPLGSNGKYTHIKETPTRIEAKVGNINLVGPMNPFPGTYDLANIGFLSDFSPFIDSASFFSTDGLFVPSGTFLNDGGITTTVGEPVFIEGLGTNSSTRQVDFRQGTVVSVASDKTIGFLPAEVADDLASAN